MHSTRQPEAAVVTYRHTVGEKGQEPAIITKLFKMCSISNYLDGMEDDVLCAEHYDLSDTDSGEEGEQIQQMLSAGSQKYFYISLAPGLVKFKSTSPTKFLTSPTNFLLHQIFITY